MRYSASYFYREVIMKKLIVCMVSFVLIAALLCVGTFALTPTYNVSEQYFNSIFYKRLCDVELTGDFAKDLAAVALSQKDYHEGNSVNDLGGTSTGYGDYTEYCSWYGRRVGWCALFISWCARQAGIPESVIKTNINASGDECRFGETKFMFGEHEPMVGDIVYVDNDSDPQADHVGIITGVDDDYIYTIEGNTSARVYAIKYKRDTGVQHYYQDTKILFYGVPEYNLHTSAEPEILMGDLDGSGKLNSTDALEILNYIVGRRQFTGDQLKLADMDGSGTITSTDALMILQICVGR